MVEDTILHTCQSLTHKGMDDEGLVTKALVDDFWHTAVSELLAVLRANSVSRIGRSRSGDEWKDLGLG